MTFDPDFASAAEWARLYRAHHIQVVPAWLPSENKSWKRPLLPSWTEYQHALVPDNVFEPWYGPGGQYTSRPNMGAICGTASDNLMIIDLDDHKHTAAGQWWRGLMARENNNMELETVEQRTGGGGRQKLFRCPSNWTPPTNKTPIGVDIRGQGGFAMLAPSIHESGKAYEWLEGRSPDDIEIMMAPDWLMEAVDELVSKYGGKVMEKTSAKVIEFPPYGNSPMDAFGHQTDMREDKMFRLIWGAVVDWYRECPIRPSDRDSEVKAAEKYLIYHDLVSPRLHDPAKSKYDLLDEEGRGPAAFHVKWQRVMAQWETNVSDAANEVPPKRQEQENKSGSTFQNANVEAGQVWEQKEPGPLITPIRGPGSLFELLDVDQILSMPDPNWLVDKLVVEEALGFIYGPPGCLKTFIALDMALSFTTGQQAWWGRPVQRQGAVIYISSEGLADLKFRLQAWQQHRQTNLNGTPFRLLRQSINFMNPDDVGKLLATVQTVADQMPIAAVFVDTVSRVLPGAEENLQKDMTLFIAACDAVRQRFKATVFGIHHTSRNGNMRGSTVMPGAGDFIIEVRREPGAMSGSIFAFKIKAAEDGWEQNFKVNKIDLVGIVPHSSLVVDPIDQKPKTEHKAGWPDTSVCREILAAIDDQWWKKTPWCYATNSSRSAIVNIMKKWRLERRVVKDIIDTWTAEGMIEEVEQDAKTHVKGYRKVFGF